MPSSGCTETFHREHSGWGQAGTPGRPLLLSEADFPCSSRPLCGALTCGFARQVGCLPLGDPDCLLQVLVLNSGRNWQKQGDRRLLTRVDQTTLKQEAKSPEPSAKASAFSFLCLSFPSPYACFHGAASSISEFKKWVVLQIFVPLPVGVSLCCFWKVPWQLQSRENKAWSLPPSCAEPPAIA